MAEPKRNARFGGLDWNLFRFGRILMDQIHRMEGPFFMEANIARGYGLRVHTAISIIVSFRHKSSIRCNSSVSGDDVDSL